MVIRKQRTSPLARFARAGSLHLLIPLFPLLVGVAHGGRTPIPARHGMVVSTYYLGSNAGLAVLEEGGNAMDAAVATAFALAVTHPAAGNIGGGGFMLFHGHDGEVTSFNFREKAPLAAKVDMFLDTSGRITNSANHQGLLSVGVPGTVAGLWLAHQRLGSKPWHELLQPAIALAERGFPSPWSIQEFMESLRSQNARIYAATKTAFLKNGKELYRPGEIWRQPDLAATLRRIQQQGKDGFYRGKTARLIADFMQRHGGLITEADLDLYQATELKPIQGTYRGYDVFSMAPPSSGGIVLIEMLNILEGYNLEALGHHSAEYLHVLSEAMRRAYADRAQFLGDPVFNPGIPVDRLISKSYAAQLRETIHLGKASPSDPDKFNRAVFPNESEETTHFSIVDAAGNAVSVTYTLEYSYGSGLVVAGAGFLLNNEMGDFNPVPGRTTRTGLIGTAPNVVAPRKQMLSSMTPTIVAKEGTPVLVIGSPGGRTIINTVLQIILNIIDHKMNIGQAIEAGRIHHQWLPDMSFLEEHAFSPDTRRLYEAMGHKIQLRHHQGAAMGISLDGEKKVIYGAADSRALDGLAAGY